MRAYKPEQINRFLEQLQAERLIPCECSTGPNKTRVWTFQRPADMPVAIIPDIPQAPADSSPFQKPPTP
jgi:hypothetical protein